MNICIYISAIQIYRSIDWEKKRKFSCRTVSSWNQFSIYFSPSVLNCTRRLFFFSCFKSILYSIIHFNDYTFRCSFLFLEFQLNSDDDNDDADTDDVIIILCCEYMLSSIMAQQAVGHFATWICFLRFNFDSFLSFCFLRCRSNEICCQGRRWVSFLANVSLVDRNDEFNERYVFFFLRCWCDC